MTKYYTCKYLEVCDCGQGQLCEHLKSENGICDLDDKTVKCPLGLKRTGKSITIKKSFVKKRRRIAMVFKKKEAL